MADDEFSFDDDKKGSDTELSLDDFFEPAGGEQAPAKTEPKGPSIDDFFSPPDDDGASELPVEKAKPEKAKPAKATPPPITKIDEIGADEVADMGGEAPPPVPLEGEGDEEAPAKSGLLSGKLIFVVIGILVLAVISGGGYLGYSLLFNKGPEVAQATPPKTPPKTPVKPNLPKPPAAKPDQPAPNKPSSNGGSPTIDMSTPGPDAVKPGKPDKPPAIEIIEDTPPAKPDKPAKPEKPVTAKPDKPPAVEIIEDNPPAKPEKPKTPARPALTGSGGPYTVQVGSYLLEASKRDPEAKLASLGYNDFHYVPEHRRIKIYNVYVGKSLTRDEAQQIKTKLENMGYYPELVPDGSGYKVKVYSYGNSATAKATQKKVARAGMKPVTVVPEHLNATLDQLRVGGYATRAEADKARRALRRAGFSGAEIVKE